MSKDVTDVAIVGAGPYGLSLAAHLRAVGVSHRIFGTPMGLWRDHMPVGMFLKSQGFASSLSTPLGVDTLGDFCRAENRRYVDRRSPIGLDTFVAYGTWFQRIHAPVVEEVLVTDIARDDDRFQLQLANGERASAWSMVVAVGVAAFARTPAVLSGLPSALVSHSSAHRDPSAFRGRDVVIVGAGQSALESAALLHEHGAQVRVLARTFQLAWNGDPLELVRPLRQRLREPESPIGSGWATWLYSSHPGLFRRLPTGQRVRRARTALGPAGAYWLRERVEGKVPVLLGLAPVSAEAIDGGVRIVTRAADGRQGEVATEHIIAATGYPPDLSRLAFIGPELRQRLRTVAATPAVDACFESSVPGLHFAGPLVAPTFGPVMRFVFGADHAARAIVRRIVGQRGRGRARGAAGRRLTPMGTRPEA